MGSSLSQIPQGYDMCNNIVFQDKESTMQLANNRWQSSRKQNQNINIHYIASLPICDPSGRPVVLLVIYIGAVSRFFTKLLQGSRFFIYSYEIRSRFGIRLRRFQKPRHTNRVRTISTWFVQTAGAVGWINTWQW